MSDRKVPRRCDDPACSACGLRTAEPDYGGSPARRAKAEEAWAASPASKDLPNACPAPCQCKEPTEFRLQANGCETRFCITCGARFETRAPAATPPAQRDANGCVRCPYRGMFSDGSNQCGKAEGHTGPHYSNPDRWPEQTEGEKAWMQNLRNVVAAKATPTPSVTCTRCSDTGQAPLVMGNKVVTGETMPCPACMHRAQLALDEAAPSSSVAEEDDLFDPYLSLPDPIEAWLTMHWPADHNAEDSESLRSLLIEVVDACAKTVSETQPTMVDGGDIRIGRAPVYQPNPYAATAAANVRRLRETLFTSPAHRDLNPEKKP